MNIRLKTYSYSFLLAILLFVSLVFIQVNWLRNAVDKQADLEKKSLQNIVPELALKVNGLDHKYFHSELDSFSESKLNMISSIVDTFLSKHGFDANIYFALYRDTLNGVFGSNTEKYNLELLNSEIKSCISCITSFSIAKDIKQRMDESDEAFRDRLYEGASFQYYSPINNINHAKGDILWLSLYYEKSFTAVMKQHLPVFILSLFLLGILLYLFYYILKTLNKYKEIGQVKDDFFNNMTHEFKTPLSSIRLASKVLRTNPTDDKRKTFLDLIEKESFLLENQIDDLLTFSMLDNDKIQLSFSTIDLHKLLLNVPIRLESIIEASNATLNLNLDANNFNVKADKIHMSNCICNLIENSLKYSSSNPKIDIFTSNKDGYLILNIRDIGIGIADKFQDKIFDKFVRGQQNNQYKGQGFGLGLSYVKSIVELHNGTIQLNKSYKLGCEFILKFKYD